MQSRRCPFCQSNASRVVGTRVDVWVKCRNCRSVFRDITPARFQQIHDESFQDSAHIDATLAFAGEQPLRTLWDLLALPGGAVLEIGPGSGHLLAAAKQAGCAVEAVESSKVHRDYIRDTWGIQPVYASMEEIPDDRVFDTIMAINVFEHVYDIGAFLSAVKKRLAPGGVFYISTPNASSLELSVLGTWWAMCKVHDHVSFPSPRGLAVAARESGLGVGRIWSTGLPCEFPVSAAAALRDRFRESRAGSASGPTPPGTPSGAASASLSAGGKAALVRFYSVAARFDPSYLTLGILGRAGTVKAMLVR